MISESSVDLVAANVLTKRVPSDDKSRSLLSTDLNSVIGLSSSQPKWTVKSTMEALLAWAQELGVDRLSVDMIIRGYRLGKCPSYNICLQRLGGDLNRKIGLSPPRPKWTEELVREALLALAKELCVDRLSADMIKRGETRDNCPPYHICIGFLGGDLSNINKKLFGR